MILLSKILKLDRTCGVLLGFCTLLANCGQPDTPVLSGIITEKDSGLSFYNQENYRTYQVIEVPETARVGQDSFKVGRQVALEGSVDERCSQSKTHLCLTIHKFISID
ncbi:MAG: hypothetical protein M3Q07_06100 [Pseudobdellovibrionaceae bacterium]|nr:hypothetical protein [Pseudobdellovibrionaceae bacterium]